MEGFRLFGQFWLIPGLMFVADSLVFMVCEEFWLLCFSNFNSIICKCVFFIINMLECSYSYIL